MKYSKQSVWKIGQAAVLGLLLATSAIAMPWDRGDDRGWGERRFHKAPHGFHQDGAFGFDPGLRLIQIGDKIDLTNEQESRILELSQKFRSEIDANREKCQAMREKMDELRDSETFDEAAIRSAMEEAYPAMVDRMILRAKYQSELNKVLTEEQKEELKAFHDKMKKHIERWKDKRMDDRPCHPGGGRGQPDID